MSVKRVGMKGVYAWVAYAPSMQAANGNPLRGIRRFMDSCTPKGPDGNGAGA